jgi:hypothetical protein
MMGSEWVTAVEVANAAKLSPKRFRAELRKKGFEWRKGRRYARWKVPRGGLEHRDMLGVLREISK